VAQTITATFNAVLNPQPISFVQTSAATPQTDQATVSRAYASAQTAGNTNIIAIGWNSSSGTISSITDSRGNVYQVAAPIARGSGLSQAIYFANNIAGAPAGGNTVTVTFSSAQPYVDLRISEYGGLSPMNPVDVASSSSGTSNSATSGTVTTSGPNELLFAAGTTIGSFSGATGGSHCQRHRQLRRHSLTWRQRRLAHATRHLPRRYVAGAGNSLNVGRSARC
jgi:hypothetical protein